jgi:hypothetical protein
MIPARRRAQILALAKRYGEAVEACQVTWQQTVPRWMRAVGKRERVERAMLAAAVRYAREERRRG